jgi:hypothetical protein
MANTCTRIEVAQIRWRHESCGQRMTCSNSGEDIDSDVQGGVARVGAKTEANRFWRLWCEVCWRAVEILRPIQVCYGCIVHSVNHDAARCDIVHRLGAGISCNGEAALNRNLPNLRQKTHSLAIFS